MNEVFIVIRTTNGKINDDFLRAFDTLEKAQKKIADIADRQRQNYPSNLHFYIVQELNSTTTTDDGTSWKIQELEIE